MTIYTKKIKIDGIDIECANDIKYISIHIDENNNKIYTVHRDLPSLVSGKYHNGLVMRVN